MSTGDTLSKHKGFLVGYEVSFMPLCIASLARSNQIGESIIPAVVVDVVNDEAALLGIRPVHPSHW
jgi:hypothetical protein